MFEKKYVTLPKFYKTKGGHQNAVDNSRQTSGN